MGGDQRDSSGASFILPPDFTQIGTMSHVESQSSGPPSPKMAHSWVWRGLVGVVDNLFGAALWMFVARMFLLKAFSGAKTIDWDEHQIPRLDGKVAVVTGANGGIGYHTVKQLALKGAKVYLGARSESRAKAAIDRLIEECPSVPRGNVVWLPLDLSKLSQVVDAALALRSKEDRLDILVNNAGIDPYDYVKTSDGFELTIAVNHIGHWTFTCGLLPLLKKTAIDKTADVRVVTVSSRGEKNASASEFTSVKDFEDPCIGPGWEASCLGQMKRYATAKRANILFARELQRRLDEESANIVSLSLHPGAVKTEGAADVMPLLTRPVVALFFMPADKGALTTLFAATAKEVREDRDYWKGGYLDGPTSLALPSPRSQDPVAARNLWTTTESAVRATGVLERI